MNRRGIPAAIAAAVLLLAAGLVLRHVRDDSPTWDEPYHLAAGAEYVLERRMTLNLEHPPLLKDLAGLAAATAGVRPGGRDDPALAGAPRVRRFLYFNTAPMETILRRARLPFVAVFLLLGAGVFLWARALYGGAAGSAAAALVALYPAFLGHAGLVATDVGAALGFLSTLALWWKWLADRRPWALAGTGAALGLALGTKFSAVLLPPILLLSGLLSLLLRGRDGGPRRASGPEALRLLAALCAAGGIALVLVLLLYAATLGGMTRGEEAAALRQTLALKDCPASWERAVLAVHRAAPPLGFWAAGLAYVARQNSAGGGVSYAAGRVSTDGFWWYFPLALLLKTPLAFLFLLAGALALRWRRPWSLEGTILAVACGVYLVVSAGSSYNIGVRHVLPLVPLLAVVASSAVPVLLDAAGPRRNTRLAAATLLAVGTLVPPLAAHPSEIAWSNALAGGTAGGEWWLNDSNVDWGQDLGRLARWSAGSDPPVGHVAYWGPAGSVPHYLPGVAIVWAGHPLPPGRYAVSSYLLHAGPEFFEVQGEVEAARVLEELRVRIREGGREVARVGASIRVYDLGEGSPDAEGTGAVLPGGGAGGGASPSPGGAAGSSHTSR